MKKKQFAVLVLFTATLFVVGLPRQASAISSTGHYDDTAWYGLSGGYSSIEVDMTPQIQDGSDPYYFANNVYFTGHYSANSFAYIGLQTHGNFGNGVDIGKMAIFSVWDVSSGIAESGGAGVPFGGEGTGYSVRIKYNWQTGTSYRLRIYIEQDASSGNKLWGGSVTNLSTGATQRIGRIYVPATGGYIKDPVTFHERYGGSTTGCNTISPSQIAFTNMTGNGNVHASSWNHYVVKTIPECPGIAWAQDSGNGYVSGVNTAKPTPPSPAPAPQPAASTKPSAKPSTPATMTPPPPTATTTPVAAATKKVDTPPVRSQPKPKKHQSIWVWPLAISLFLLAVAGVLFLRRSFYVRRYLSLLKKQFPYDYDIHGPRLDQ